MNLKVYNTLTEFQKRQLLDLWNEEYPVNLAYESMDEFEAYLEKLTNLTHILVETYDGKIKGWFFYFTREQATWFVIILSKDIQGQGMGTTLIKKAQESELELNGWATDHNRFKKRNGEFYQSPLSFYKKNGFEILREIRIDTEKLSAVKIQWKR